MKYLIIFTFLFFSMDCLANDKYMEKLAGVWKIHSADGKEVPAEFYMQLKEDGTAETWPVSKCWGEEKTSKGKYRATKKEFIVVMEKGEDIASKYKLKGNKLLIKARVDTVYIRDENPPNPGELKNPTDSSDCNKREK